MIMDFLKTWEGHNDVLRATGFKGFLTSGSHRWREAVEYKPPQCSSILLSTVTCQGAMGIMGIEATWDPSWREGLLLLHMLLACLD